MVQEEEVMVVGETAVLEDHIRYLDHPCFMVVVAAEETITEEQ
jgi:hypothetical protein